MQTDDTSIANDENVNPDTGLQPIVPVHGSGASLKITPKKPSFLKSIFSPPIRTPKAASKHRRFAAYACAAIGFAGYFCMAGLIGAFGWAAKDMPQTSALWAPESTPEIVIFDRHGREILRTGGAESKPVSLANIPPARTDALIAI